MKKKVLPGLFIPICFISLSCSAVDYFTESTYSFDMDGHSITFTPDGSASGYSVAGVPITALPTDPAGHQAIALGHNHYIEVPVTSGETVQLYSNTYNRFYIGSNGYITFGSGDTSGNDSLETHFSMPRISALFEHLNPTQAGTVTWTQLSNRMVVTFSEVTQCFSENSNTFQVEMFFDGRISISWLGIEATWFLVGLSEGNGVPDDFTESDFSAYVMDLDGDGMPDAWEELYFDDATNCLAHIDTDGDGHCNLEEYISGMHPLDTGSVFRVTQQMEPGAEGEILHILEWDAVEGREYSIRCDTDLMSGSFSNTLQSGIAYPVNAYTVTVAEAQSQCYFKVDVQLAE